VKPGEKYVDEIVLLSGESPNAQPPITMAMRTGTFRLVYAIQRTDREGYVPLDLVPLEQRVSNEFRIDPPEPTASRSPGYGPPGPATSTDSR
jgi:hypothetical protein